MKEWENVRVNGYKKVKQIIEEKQKNGWNLHSYQCMHGDHYLLFERETRS